VIRGSKKPSSLVTAKAQAQRDRVSGLNERIDPYYRVHRRRRGCCIPADTVETDLLAQWVERQMFATSSRSGVRLVAPPILKQLQPAVDVPPSDDTTVDQGQKKAVEVERRRGGEEEVRKKEALVERRREEKRWQTRVDVESPKLPFLSLSRSRSHSPSFTPFTADGVAGHGHQILSQIALLHGA